MSRYLLDTNHLSAYLDGQPALESRIDGAIRAGDRFGICLPVQCEYRAGIRLGRRWQRNAARLQAAMAILRQWPVDIKRLWNSRTSSWNSGPWVGCCRLSIC